MTIKHIVLLALKPSLSKQDIHTLMTALSDLQHSIPEIQSFTWGENNSHENLHQGFLHGFTMEFKNQTDRDAYIAHPEHVKIAQNVITPALIDGFNSVVVFDYEG